MCTSIFQLTAFRLVFFSRGISGPNSRLRQGSAWDLHPVPNEINNKTGLATMVFVDAKTTGDFLSSQKHFSFVGTSLQGHSAVRWEANEQHESGNCCAVM